MTNEEWWNAARTPPHDALAAWGHAAYRGSPGLLASSADFLSCAASAVFAGDPVLPEGRVEEARPLPVDWLQSSVVYLLRI